MTRFITPHIRWWLSVLGVIVIAYVLFHRQRAQLAPGFFRDAFPSLMVPTALFAVIKCVPAIMFRDWRWKCAVTGLTTLVAMAAFEWLQPQLQSRATGDLNDVYAMGVGLLIYWGLAFLAPRRIGVG